MYLGTIIGSVAARMRLPGMDALKLVVVQPLDFNLLPVRFAMIATDLTGASVGSLIAFEEGREAANPYDPPLPIDACIVAIVDHVDFHPEANFPPLPC